MNKLLILIFLTGCSYTQVENWKKKKPNEVKLNGFVELEAQDYIDHLKSFEDIYKSEHKKSINRLSGKSLRYLNSIIKKISSNNELFFQNREEPTFYIINSSTPFHFSLPGSKFFLSSSLLEKYIKNEAMLYCLLTYEFIRSEKSLYKKSIIIPTGTIETKRILSLLRLETKDKVEVHKWAYYILKRVGIDTDMYLTWLQVKNRNSLDFATQLGDIQSISREESLYKAFVIEYEKKTESRKTSRHRGSSRNFYAFLSDVKR